MKSQKDSRSGAQGAATFHLSLPACMAAGRGREPQSGFGVAGYRV